MLSDIKIVLENGSNDVTLINKEISNFDFLVEAFWDFQDFHILIKRDDEDYFEYMFKDEDFKVLILSLNKKTNLTISKNLIESYSMKKENFTILFFWQVTKLLNIYGVYKAKEIIDNICANTTFYLLSNFEVSQKVKKYKSV